MSRYFVGVDLGQAQDDTAVAVLARPVVGPGAPAIARRPTYTLPHLARFPLGTPYPAVVAGVLGFLRTPALRGCVLVVDQTGVGRAVVDILADGLRGQVDCTVCPVTITAGRHVTAGTAGSLHVPKRELVGVLQGLLQARRLQIARTLPDAAVLVKELEHFRVKITTTCHETFAAWRAGQHDDLVLAVALAVWAGERGLPPPIDPPPEPDVILIAGPGSAGSHKTES